MPTDQSNAVLDICKAVEENKLEVVKSYIAIGKDSIDAFESDVKKVVQFLLSIDIKNINNCTLLYHAICKGDFSISQLLLEKGVETSRKQEGAFYLHHAVREGKTEIIKQLLQYGADPNAREDGTHKTALHEAVIQLDPKAIFLLTPATQQDMKGARDKDSLPRLTAIEMIIHELADDIQHCNMYSLNIKEDDRIDSVIPCIRAFLFAGAEINEDLVSQTVKKTLVPQVMEIIKEAKMLIESVQKKYAQDSEVIQTLLFANRVSLSHAIRKNDLEKVKLLVKSGAVDLTINQAGYTPLHEAAASGHPEIIKFLISEKAEVVDAEPCKDYFEEDDLYAKYTPLAYAIESRNLYSVQLLLKAGADGNKRDIGYLHLAAARQQIDIMKELLRYGIDPNAIRMMDDPSSRGTALDYAVVNGQPNSVFFLYPYTNTEIKGFGEKTAFDYLIEKFVYYVDPEDWRYKYSDAANRVLRAFLLAGANINEELVSKSPVIKNQRFVPDIMQLIEENKRLVDSIQKEYAKLGSEVVQHLLFAYDDKARNALKQEIAQLEQLGYHNPSLIMSFLLASPAVKEKFMYYHNLFHNQHETREEAKRNKNIAFFAFLPLPPENRLQILEETLLKVLDPNAALLGEQKENTCIYAHPRQ